jgi:hypothetical protein
MKEEINYLLKKVDAVKEELMRLRMRKNASVKLESKDHYQKSIREEQKELELLSNILLSLYSWEPIESAPKDGTKVLVCNVNHYEPITANYRTYHPNAQGKKTWRAGQMGNKINPTHWMWQLEAPID